jgi:hypothetical protein
MFQVDIYGRIRRAVLVEGRSQRSVAQEFGLARVTVRVRRLRTRWFPAEFVLGASYRQISPVPAESQGPPR